MSRIDDPILNSVIYLYPSREAAEDGEARGGTGFLASIPANEDGRVFIYAVTNSHVVNGAEGTSPVIRLNGFKGFTIVPLNAADWVHHPDGDDVAVYGPMHLPDTTYDCIPTSWFITPNVITLHEIGPGDETFMVGRFSVHEGRSRNLPTVRFGNISMMNHEPVEHHRGIRQESFLVEARSLGGYSGSPVFVRIPSDSIRPQDRRSPNRYAAVVGFGPPSEMGPWLLGIDYGHLPLFEKVRGADGKPAPEALSVRSNSGVMGVVPAWRILELLNSPELARDRSSASAHLMSDSRTRIDHTDAPPGRWT